MKRISRIEMLVLLVLATWNSDLFNRGTAVAAEAMAIDVGGRFLTMAVRDDLTVVCTGEESFVFLVGPDGAVEMIGLRPSLHDIYVSQNGRTAVGWLPIDLQPSPVWTVIADRSTNSYEVPEPLFPADVEVTSPIQYMKPFSVSDEGIVVGQVVCGTEAPGQGAVGYPFIWFPGEARSRILPPMPGLVESGGAGFVSADGKWAAGFSQMKVRTKVVTWPARWFISDAREITPEPLEMGKYTDAVVLGLSQPELIAYGIVDYRPGYWRDGVPVQVDVNMDNGGFLRYGAVTCYSDGVMGGWASDSRSGEPIMDAWISFDGVSGRLLVEWWAEYTGQEFPFREYWEDRQVESVRNLVSKDGKLYIATNNGYLLIVDRPKTAVDDWLNY